MSAIIIIPRTAVQKALRISVRVLLAVGCGLGIAVLAPAIPPDVLPASLSNSRKTPGVVQADPAALVLIPAKQDPLPQLAPTPGAQEKSQPSSAQELPTPLSSYLMAANVARSALAAIGSTPVQRDPLARPAFPPRTQEPAPANRAQKLPAPLPASGTTQIVEQPKMTASTAAPAPAKQEAIPPVTPPSLTPDQVPPKKPLVSYESGQLTIVAENSTLSDILSALRARMGTDVDIPASASGERMWANIGPGPARKVLATLLSQTSLDYLIQASDPDTDPDGIRSVSLTARTDAPAATVKTRPTFVQALPPRQSDAERRVPVPNHTPAEDRVAEEPVPPPVPSEPAAPAAAADAASAPAQPAPVVVPENQGTDPNKPAASSTSEQMMHMLQNMYQERKQQMQVAQKPSGTN